MNDDDMLKEVYELFDDLPRTVRKRKNLTAIIGNGQGVVNVANRPGYVYARLQTSAGTETVIHLYAPNVRHMNNNPVEIQKNQHGFYETVGVDSQGGPAFWSGFSTGGGGPHAESHGLYGDDPLWVDTRQLTLFLVHPTNPPSLSVDMEPGIFRNMAGAWVDFIGGTVDLTSFMPTNLNEQRLIIVGLDKTSEATTAIAGTATVFNNYQPETVPFSLSDIVTLLNTADPEFDPKMAVRLMYGQTLIQQWDCFFDCRLLSTEIPIILPEQGGGGFDLTTIQGFLFYNGVNTYQVHCVGDQITAPTVNDDETSTPHPFGVLSLWVTSVTAGAAEDAVYMCVDPSDGAAVWLRLDGASGGGTVTSVGLTMPTIFSVLGTPVTTSGTLAVSLNNQSGNVIFASPANGSNGIPTFRAMVAADIPDNSITAARLADIPGLSVIGRAASGTGDPGVITFTADNQFLVRRSGALTVGALVAADIPNLAASIITSGVFDNARINWAAPGAIGTTTPSAGNFTAITGAGNLLVSGAGYEIQLSAPSGNFRNFRLMTTASGTPANRWNITANSTAESGSNAGSDFAIRAFDDSGNFLVQPILITRASGKVTLSGELQIGGALNHDGTTIGFNGSTPVAKGTITGSRNNNEALQSLLDFLESRGDIIDSTTASG